MATGRIKVWIKGVVDPLEAMESINTFPGREIHHLQVVEFHHSVNQLLPWATRMLPAPASPSRAA